MYTLFASAPVAFAMMLAYLATLSAIAVALDRNNITLKFW